MWGKQSVFYSFKWQRQCGLQEGMMDVDVNYRRPHKSSFKQVNV